MKSKLIRIAALIIALFTVTAFGCAKGGNSGNRDDGGDGGDGGTPQGDLPYLTVSGTDVVDENGEEVILRGINAGGLFVTEHWMTGFNNSSPKNDNLSLSRTFIERFGEDATKELWQTYQSNWWSEIDFENCAEMGINVIRLPFTYMNVDFAAITDLNEAGKNYDFTALDAFVDTAAQYGIYTILDMHGAYGSQNGQDHSGQVFDTAAEVTFYHNEQLMQLTADLWKAISIHYKNNPNVAGYDLLNEPGEKAGLTERRHWDCFDRFYEAIRDTGDEHIIIFESCWDGANLPRPEEYGWENCMYSFHHYTGDSMSYEQFCQSWSAKIAEVESYDFGVPLYMGEFTAYGVSKDWWNYCLELLNEHGWHWTSWTYKVWGEMAWGVINLTNGKEDKVSPDTDSYEDILAKFGKLKTQGGKQYAFGDGTVLKDIIKQYAEPDGTTDEETAE